MNLEEYIERYRETKTVSFTEPHDGFVFVNVENEFARAAISVYGGQVISFAPRGCEDVLWMSRECFWQQGKAIRGGVPVCWPWFGAHPVDPGKPAHGLARVCNWDIVSIVETSVGGTAVTLVLRDNAETRKIWDYAFCLELVVTVEKTLKMELKTTNAGVESFDITEALHTYFTIGDISRVGIAGFDQCPYFDSLTKQDEIQSGDITFSTETDRIYYSRDALNAIIDPVMKRSIVHRRTNSATSVVWNPWIEKSKRMPDFGDDEFKRMLCLETANVRNDFVTVGPGSSHIMTAEIAVE